MPSTRRVATAPLRFAFAAAVGFAVRAADASPAFQSGPTGRRLRAGESGRAQLRQYFAMSLFSVWQASQTRVIWCG
ncbi:hypothetical protein [Variovorax sp. KK3]|uniref:hypothetical protein n=1 Tax=Variovorax sp. KK3 TaxID=1855728 RepID=UPI00097C5A73|nr:hypothetical protein [Variovorax sp. KK3]